MRMAVIALTLSFAISSSDAVAASGGQVPNLPDGVKIVLVCPPGWSMTSIKPPQVEVRQLNLSIYALETNSTGDKAIMVRVMQKPANLDSLAVLEDFNRKSFKASVAKEIQIRGDLRAGAFRVFYLNSSEAFSEEVLITNSYLIDIVGSYPNVKGAGDEVFSAIADSKIEVHDPPG